MHRTPYTARVNAMKKRRPTDRATRIDRARTSRAPRAAPQ
jgi:hypothetical protein